MIRKKRVLELDYGTLFDRIGYNIGARIRSMLKADKEDILNLGLKDGELASLTIKDRRHVISMSDSRARKDAKDRAKGVKRLEKRFANGKITKAYFFHS